MDSPEIKDDRIIEKNSIQATLEKTTRSVNLDTEKEVGNHIIERNSVNQNVKSDGFTVTWSRCNDKVDHSHNLELQEVHSDKEINYENHMDLHTWRKDRKNYYDPESNRFSDNEPKENYISIQRNIIHHDELDKKDIKSKSFCINCKNLIIKCCKCSPVTCIYSVFPLLYWLPRYPLKKYLLCDIMTGFILAVLQIPQGMAYALLARVDPVYGLYVSFFPVMIYFLMGTSHHVSIGTFSVISIMISNALAKFDESYGNDYSNTTASFRSNGTLPKNIDVAISLGLMVGIWQFLFGVLKLGILTFILSDQLISGFTSAAAIHVGTSQVKDLFGINVGIHTGQFQLIQTYIDIFNDLKNTNLVTLSISAISLFTLAVVKDHINDRFQHKMIMPFPIDLVVVIVGTLASYYGNFNTKYHVKVVETIPSGLPGPSVPRLEFLPYLILDGLIIGIIIYVITYSLAKIFARKREYEIDPSQEFLALGSANIFSSFFSCYPCSASVSRSSLQDKTGGKTQVTNLISSSLILIVLFFLAPLLYSLPRAVWMVTFLSVVILSIDVGLLVGVVFSLVAVMMRVMIPNLITLGNLPNTEIYMDAKRYTKCVELENIIIYYYEGGLCFLNRELFKNSMIKKTVEKSKEKVDDDKLPSENHQHLNYVILDCSSISLMDINAAKTFQEIRDELHARGIMFILTKCPAFVHNILTKTEFFKSVKYPCIFPSIHDAVVYCQHNYVIRL
ncbi:solute carrier family 26 member 10-like isoform X2 [Centruroides sculpturatus]|uniref:solute carrier family 26 member 10-like isoform X2 n=1 Tax=Centruroides sculpturatus TaxID=218467 RepID=UPI000C6EA739|nr:solute carrier family 26 member 10-like isoform X2 [Centruroides sculpturatus]